MSKQSKLASGLVILIGLVALVMASTALARPDSAGKRGGPPKGGPMFGEILSISDSSITIAPSLPDFVKERMADRGLEAPTDLPDEVTIALTGDTVWVAAGEDTDSTSFSVGDMIVVAAKPGDDGQLVAAKVADVESARQAIQKARQERGGNQGNNERGNRGQGFEQGQGNQQGQGKGDKRGGQGKAHQRQRPAFGAIIAMDADSITIRPEIPAFIQAKMDERGSGKEIELPDELTFSLGEKTHYVVDSEPVDSNPFSVGDKVAVMGGRGAGKAMAVADYATAEAKMKELGGKGQAGKQGKQGKKGKKGKGGKGGKHPDGQQS